MEKTEDLKEKRRKCNNGIIAITMFVAILWILVGAYIYYPL
ncbi:MAG TPA: hypothetical protein VJX93_01900 [Candidatus Methanomethylophilaceae archaeon]|nr:hypothetical protein [Candidatus Methanomethylophilaceae archaeon]